MSRDLSPRELDHGLPDLADLRPSDRESREIVSDKRSATSRTGGHAPERFSRDRLAEIRFAGGRALMSRQGSSCSRRTSWYPKASPSTQASRGLARPITTRTSTAYTRKKRLALKNRAGEISV